MVNTIVEQPYIELDYYSFKEPRKYKVRLVTTPSNLGFGTIWYFLCPQTNKRCHKLYSIGGYFLHRKAFNGCMYDCQIESKYYRQLNKILDTIFNTDLLYKKLYKKNFKKTYAGKPTKRYLQIMEQIQKAESIPYDEIEMMMIN